MALISSKNHYIPGYAGCCPRYKYRIADITTHKILLDPTLHHAETILSDRTADNYKTVLPSGRDIDIANERQGNTIYKHPMVPGYGGFVPNEHAKMGHSYTIQATEAISDFEVYQNQDKAAMKKIFELGSIRDKEWDPEIWEDEELEEDEIELPLLEPLLVPPDLANNHYLSDYIHPEKYLMSGYTGHVPFGYHCFGNMYDDFTSNHSKRLNKEGIPVEIYRPDPSVLIPSLELYRKKVGQMPHYGGHIPGAIFRSGKTYGNDSKDAKRSLRLE